jgi:hypothetical protein
MISLAFGVFCRCPATGNPASNSTTGAGGASSYMGFPLPRAPGSVGRQPCGQDPPLVGQMGQDNFVDKDRDKVVDEEEDDDDADVDEDLDRSSSERWVPRSGPPVCVFLCPWVLRACGASVSPRWVLRRGFLGSCFSCRHYLILESI